MRSGRHPDLVAELGPELGMADEDPGWRPQAPLRPSVAVGVSVALVLGAVVLFFAWLVGDVPAYRLDLPGTTWAVATIDGRPLPAPVPLIEFSSDGNSAMASMACGQVPLDWAWDSDGAALGFGYERLPDSCVSRTTQDDALLDAILGIEEWSYQSDDRITLIGTNELRLARAPKRTGDAWMVSTSAQWR